ncbi:hypothetical protein HanPI659440_Chr01g0003641 [Helianthus annuus]|nr:hypothetical protein HanPI659440_Chr01g0003641 [Helianthus annuus]
MYNLYIYTLNLFPHNKLTTPPNYRNKKVLTSRRISSLRLSLTTPPHPKLSIKPLPPPGLRKKG